MYSKVFEHKKHLRSNENQLITAIIYYSHFANEIRNTVRRSILCENGLWKDGSALAMPSHTPHQNIASPGLSNVLGTGKEHIAHITSYTYGEG